MVAIMRQYIRCTFLRVRSFQIRRNHQIREGIWMFNGPASGRGHKQTITIMGGIHGNERLGVEVVNKLIADFESGTRYIRAPDTELILALGNPPAIDKSERASSPSEDLNRCFRSELLSSNATDSSYEVKRAKELAPFLRRTDILIDLHGTNKSSEPFVRIAGFCTTEHLLLASWLSCLKEGVAESKLKLLLDPFYSIGGGVCTTDEFVGSVGGIGICFEAGLHSDLSLVPVVYNRLLEYLRFTIQIEGGDPIHHSEMAPYGVRQMKTNTSAKVDLQPFFDDIFEPYVLKSSEILNTESFEWAEGVGEDNWQFLAEDSVIGHKISSSGSENVTAITDSYILFPKPKHLHVPFKPLFWLASKVKLSYLAGQDFAKPKLQIPSSGKSSEMTDEQDRKKMNPKYTEYQKRIIKHNSDYFVASLYSEPGLFRKSSKSPWTVVDQKQHRHLLDNTGEMPRKVQQVRMPAQGSGSLGLDGYPFTSVLERVLKVEARTAGKIPKKSEYPKIVRENFLFFPKITRSAPIYVYPTVTQVVGEHSLRGVAPFWCARLTLPFQVHHASCGSAIYFGIRRDDPVARAICVKTFGKYSFRPTVVVRKNIVYIEAKVIGDSYLAYDLSATEPSYGCIRVMGNDKDAVGATYEGVCLAMGMLSSEANKTIFQFHPTYDVRGVLVSEFGAKKPLVFEHDFEDDEEY